ncbi:MAG: glycosyltransferase, partial [Candidatus Limnocylindrales bacterium]
RVLIEAIGLLVARGVAVSAALVGEGEERPRLEASIASAGLAGQVELVGRQPREQVADLVRAADVVVQPSIVLADGKTEGIPVALMEAMASGVPVVATAVSGVPELVEPGMTGWLVPPDDALALANALLDVRAEPARTALLAEAGRARVLDAFDLRIETRRLATLLIGAAQRAGRDVGDLPPREPDSDQGGSGAAS